MKIEIRNSTLIINTQTYHFPIDYEEFKKQVGIPSKVWEKSENHILTWDNLGIFAHRDKKNTIYSLNIYLKEGDKLDYLPRQTFQGEYLIEGKNIKQREVVMEEIHGELAIYNFLNDDENEIRIAFIDYFPTVDPSEKIFDEELYTFRPLDGKEVTFKDFNFKLAVIQVLMYEKQLLEPYFDIVEFAKWYSQRDIDLDKEGHDIIPEVKSFFETLPIDEELALKVTEIHQSVENAVYMNILMFWDGSGSPFHITSAEDAENFPNLKKVNLFMGEGTHLSDEFKRLNIEVNKA